MNVETLRIEGIPQPVARVALGTWAIGGWKWGGADDAESVAAVRSAVDRGLNLIDTAPIYGQGHAETIVGRALAGGRRAQAVIATKVGMNWNSPTEVFRDSRPQRIRDEIEASLRRLQTDYIDLYQVHWPDPLTEIETVADELEKLRRAGKILAIGVSNFSVEQMQRFRAVAPLASVQPPYNLFERQVDADILPYAQRSGLAMLAYGSICRGLLSGRITEETVFAGDDLRGYDPKFVLPARHQYLAAVRALDAYAQRRHGQRVLALAVRWVLERGPTIALWGARRPAQLDDVAAVFGWRLDAEDLAQIDAIVAAAVTVPVAAGFFAPPQRAA